MLDRKNPKDSHYQVVIDAIKQGTIIPFLSSDVNLCGRKKKPNGEPVSWQDDNYPPSGYELAIHLAKTEDSEYLITCPLCNTSGNPLPLECPINNKDAIIKLALANVSQYLDLCDPDTLEATLTEIIEAKYLPNPVHKFLAKLPSLLQKPPYPLIVTTCFDSVLEQSFREEHQEFDLVAFISNAMRGQFQHTPFDGKINGETIIIEDPQNYSQISLEKRPVILKLYGGVDIGSGKKFTISEDDLIDYLTQRRIEELLPPSLLAALKEKNRRLWFLEYSPSHWNLRLILRRIWRDNLYKTDKKWWAVQEHPEHLDDKFWEKYGVNANFIPSLEEYITELEKRLKKELTLPGGETSVATIPQSVATIPKKDSTTPKPLQRTGVFISYSHEDEEWLKKFKKMYSPINNGILWDDSQIQPGMKWQEEIEKALASAKVAVLLVSDNFVGSEFITKNELPPLLEAAEKEGLTIFWICLTSCMYKRTPIDKYQPAHNVRQPLDMLTSPQQNAVLVEICEKLDALINPSN